MKLLKYQSEAEEVVKNVTYDLYAKDGEIRLIDSTMGAVSKIRFPYVCDSVKLNRFRLNHLIETLADWTDDECLQARQELAEGTEIDLALKDDSPKR